MKVDFIDSLFVCQLIGYYTLYIYFMCLFLEILWVKKRRNLSVGKYFPITVNIFPMAKIWTYSFEITSLNGVC